MGLFTQSENKIIIGIIHVKALPSTSDYDGEISAVYQAVVKEAVLLESVGFDALMIENMHDIPYLNRKVGPEITATIEDVRIAKEVSVKPIIIGSGITENNIKDYWRYADGFIVGTSLKKDNYWGNPVDEQKAESFITEVRRLRRNYD